MFPILDHRYITSNESTCHYRRVREYEARRLRSRAYTEGNVPPDRMAAARSTRGHFRAADRLSSSMTERVLSGCANLGKVRCPLGDIRVQDYEHGCEALAVFSGQEWSLYTTVKAICSSIGFELNTLVSSLLGLSLSLQSRCWEKLPLSTRS